MKELKLGLKIGILGGGQLARMLAISAHQMGYTPVIASSHSTDPAAQVVSSWQSCQWSEKELKAFLKSVDVSTFESEFLDAELLHRISQQEQCPLYPSAEVMGQLQDRKTQKALYEKFGIPSSESIVLESADDVLQAFAQWGGVVVKVRRGGYDGYGTFIAKNKKELKVLHQRLKEGDLKNSASGFIIEKWINFKREVALIIARDQHHHFFSYPLVESRQTQAKCDWVMGPVKHQALSKIQKKLQTFLTELNYVGVMGVEMFDTGAQLLVNEIAPRVHNSGHYTQASHDVNQFDLHIKCISGEPIPEILALQKGFAMANLVGQSGSHPQIDQKIGSHFHWYGKLVLKEGRKMGHINAVANTPQKALAIALQKRKKVKL